MVTPHSDEVRIDLHVHSHFSDRPYSYLLRAGRSAECYTTPRQVYETARQRGMNLVTITDHDTIDGALELCSVTDDSFISEEVSARFPEDGCVLHTIALDLTEAQHHELQRLRGNIYELTAYMNEQQIAHFLCHPLSQVNRRLTPSHLERAFLMFRALELVNGTRDPEHERCLRRIVANITPAHLARWRELHPTTPVFNPDGRFAFVGGSDDHGRLAIARAHTSFSGPRSGAGLRAALFAGTTRPSGNNARVETLTNNVYGVLFGYLKSSGQLDVPRRTFGVSASVSERVAAIEWPEVWRRGHTDAGQHQIGRTIDGMLLDVYRGAVGRLAAAAGDIDLNGVTDAVPDVLRTVLLSLPAFLAPRYHARDRAGARRFAAQLGFGEPGDDVEAPRVAILTDTVDDINGVALGLRRLMRAAGGHVRLVAIGDGDRIVVDDEGVVRIPAVYKRRLALYPQMEFGIPHVTALLSYLVDEGIDIIQCATPGPMGLSGLLAARLTGIPILGQYHTDVPEYATRLSGDPVFGEMVGALVGWFYRQMNQVLVPSRFVAEKMQATGVLPERIVRVPRGIDLELFRPQRRNPHAFDRFGVGAATKVLYVGRLSKEKGLDALVERFAALGPALDAKLILVGDGPHAEALRARADHRAVVFAGAHTGTALAELMASADLFVSPSETETFGNAVVEAQAAGLPVVVASRGAACENLLDGVTGLVVDTHRPEALDAALWLLVTDEALRKRMSAAAHRFAQGYGMSEAVRGTFNIYRRFFAHAEKTAPLHHDHDETESAA
jgi:glycosyltransferase involved in cell wall biosynthesis